MTLKERVIRTILDGKRFGRSGRMRMVSCSKLENARMLSGCRRLRELKSDYTWETGDSTPYIYFHKEKNYGFYPDFVKWLKRRAV